MVLIDKIGDMVDDSINKLEHGQVINLEDFNQKRNQLISK